MKGSILTDSTENIESATQERTMRGKLYLLISTLSFILFPFHVFADVEGTACTSDPMAISYGGLITCSIETVGDTDLFTFSAQAQVTVEIQVTRQGAGSPCVELFDPNGTPVPGGNCNSPSLMRTIFGKD